MKIPTDLWNWVVHLIKENRPVWLANGVEIGPADRIDISATVTRSGNTLSISGMGAGAHGIVSASHTASGTAGQVLQLTESDVFGWGAITDGMIPATIARDTEVAASMTYHTDTDPDPHPQYSNPTGIYLPIGANGTIWTADDTQPDGVKWTYPKQAGYILFGTSLTSYQPS